MGGIGFGESSWFNALHRIEPRGLSSRMSPSPSNGYSRRALTVESHDERRKCQPYRFKTREERSLS
jgi:hypothetical protein